MSSSRGRAVLDYADSLLGAFPGVLHPGPRRHEGDHLPVRGLAGRVPVRASAYAAVHNVRMTVLVPNL